MGSITKTNGAASAQKVTELIAKAVFTVCAVLAIFAVASRQFRIKARQLRLSEKPERP